jgi:hypothetical protein
MGQKFKLIACEAVKGELDALLPECKNTIDITIIDKGLHSVGQIKMLAELQKAIDAIDTTGYEALLLGYGLCNNGICGLHAAIPLVVPRAHDCITFFMGSKEKYRDYFNANKGSFFMSAGSNWRELLDNGFDEEKLRAEYVEKYGEEDAEYLMETLGDPLREYRQLTFVNNGVGDIEGTRALAKDIAASRSWTFDEFPGSPDLLRRFLDGDWDSADFLVTPPGSEIRRYFSDDEIVEVGVSMDRIPAEKT